MPTKIITRERPIIFSGPMVKPILADKKTQSRRIVKLPNDFAWINAKRMFMDNPHPVINGEYYGISDGKEIEIKCPYGKEGDLLWVRETYTVGRIFDEVKMPGQPIHKVERHYVQYDGVPVIPSTFEKVKRVPSIHMPRIHSRIRLRVLSIGIERLQDMTDDDAVAEGIGEMGPEWYRKQFPGISVFPGLCVMFEKLWDSINAKKEEGKYSWKSNPWVWVVTFKVEES